MSRTSIDPSKTIGELLLSTPQHGAILKSLGIHPTRDAGKTLAGACRSRGLETRTTVRLLTAMLSAARAAPVVCLELMTLGELRNHLENAHRNLHDELKRLDRLTKTSTKENATEHPKLPAIRKCFRAFRRRFKAHLRREVGHLFPIIRQLEIAKNGAGRGYALLRPLLAQLEREHNQADEGLDDLRTLVGDDASSSSAQAALELAEAVVRLEHVVHEQIYKESRVLFPRAMSRQEAALARTRDWPPNIPARVHATRRRKPVRFNKACKRIL